MSRHSPHNNNFVPSIEPTSQSERWEQQQILESPAPSHAYIQPELCAREGRSYDPTLLQYQQTSPIATDTKAIESTTEDFEENLFNSLMYSVDESTEKEILKNLNIREDELLGVYNLNNGNSSQVDVQDYQTFGTNEDQSFDEKIFDKIQRQSSYEYKPETQKLLKETRDNLEKELSLFREIDLHDPQHNMNEVELGENSEMMQISPTNPKYINHAQLDDHLLYKWVRGDVLGREIIFTPLSRTIDEQIGLDEMCSSLIRDMNEYGVCVMDNFIGHEKGVKVLQEVNSMYSAGYFKVEVEVTNFLSEIKTKYFFFRMDN